eukprot:scaffold3474_cov111-Isochrysis_galbana.AAC.2
MLGSAETSRSIESLHSWRRMFTAVVLRRLQDADGAPALAGHRDLLVRPLAGVGACEALGANHVCIQPVGRRPAAARVLAALSLEVAGAGASTADADDVPAVAPEPTDQCGVMVHTDLDGTASFSWGYGPQGLKAQTAGECCEKCRQHHKCNTFSWCGQPLCFAPDIWCAKRQGSRQLPAIPPSDEISSFCFGRAHPAACPLPPAQEPLVWRVLAQAVSGSDGTPGQHERRLHGQVPETASDGAAPSGVDRGRAQVEEPGGQRHVEQPRGLVSDGTSTHYTPTALSRY